jgi:hypothetical protein
MPWHAERNCGPAEVKRGLDESEVGARSSGSVSGLPMSPAEVVTIASIT